MVFKFIFMAMSLAFNLLYELDIGGKKIETERLEPKIRVQIVFV